MLSKEEILHIATLARIGVSEQDVEKYQHDLSEILDYFKKLDEVDVTGVEPIGHITGMQNTFRSDEHFDFGELGKEEIMKNVPEVKEGFIKVKSVL
ncbi:MAG: Aspartyl/glutamyl-tRNA(Asn/Gln) amidotransferase subunit C [Candidatus Moranbacteria bacterium GW2011_GWC2_37_73]|nr:MAG: Aspartyl/glutamyl-tRNA(Asn/Gln) amidotransferase subunit C [Parcubacteria group bacterium GW2011_GWC1_36_108]KKQ00762.1 MAG: Aspartyl/glutamyl-tRNA(Asn/Gln) amidotransferase subunit C [Candidatus Moranbacteria bacterium GW2011_GWD1_36_198]KKQ02223.1 MAG: Aspartyl/glutamyl-tRNA(Asn/Gln) amidotransferase subunit C [Candidatus Moranbacteria bacterium GW2011_GWD2_36_198]KKQ39688.1 MAG: Aspartyl/glutamyl-tRNA(Asn/Gln) amidotransferase subunit C [Candidatus Moranbacteria bacterium GW2011_GWC2_